MRAFVIEGRRVGRVRKVAPPAPAPGEVVARVTRAGVCGTDRELFDGTLPAASAAPSVPFIPGHEWVGVVEDVGAGVDSHLIGTRVIGDTFIGCGRCTACLAGRTSVCGARREVGVRGWNGALAELVVVPVANAVPVPDELDDAGAALVEPLSNAVRAIAEVPRDDRSVLIRGAGTLGILASRVAGLRSLDVVVVDRDSAAVARAAELGCTAVPEVAEGARFDAVIDMAASAPVDELWNAVRDGGTVILTGFPSHSSSVPARELVERDLRVIGTLGAPKHLARSIDIALRARVGELVGQVRGLDGVLPFLEGQPADSVKLQIDPRLPSEPVNR